MPGIHHKLCDECKSTEKWDLMDIESFLKDNGVQYFLTTDGIWIIDEKNKLSFSSGHEVINGKKITKTKEVNFDTDFFNVVWIQNHCYPTWLSDPAKFRFVGKSPLPNEYNAAIIKKLCAYHDGAIDGSSDYEMYSVLLLKVEVRHKTAEELAEDERIRNLPKDPPDDFPVF